MAMILRLLARVAVIVVLAFIAMPVTAQNVLRLRIDTVTTKPGSTVDVRVLYTFTSTHPHNIHDFLARFLFDTTKSALAGSGYIMNGAATYPLFDTVPSHTGLLVYGNQEIDLTDSVLFTIRMTLDTNADTAWIRWDRKWPVMQLGNEGVDSVYQQDGWIRSSKPLGIVQSVSDVQPSLTMYPNPAEDHVMISAPGYGDGSRVEVYDAAGRLSFEGPLVHGGWQIPSGFPAGAYEVLLSDESRTVQNIGTLIVSPR